MTAFFDLFAGCSRPENRPPPEWADRRFPDVVQASPLRLWRPGDPIPRKEMRLLLGVATWSGYDMRLLDIISEAMRRDPVDGPIVELFNAADCKAPDDFQKYIPG